MMHTAMQQPPAPPPPQTPIMPVAVHVSAAKELSKRILNIITELSKVMEEETPILLARDYSKQDGYLRRKQELTLDYQSALKVLIENKTLFACLSPDDVKVLRSSGKKLDDLTAQNADALRVAHHANEHFLKVVINEMRRDLHKESGYSGRGVLALAEANKARPVSFNQRI